MPRGRKRKEVLEASVEPMEEGTDGPFDEITDNGGEEEAPQESMADESVTQDAQDMPAEDDLPPSPSKIDLAKVQDELTSLDVLVCGKCHGVFYFVPELQDHKISGCPGFSTVFSNSTKADSKAQVWAFVLYKAAKMKEHSQAGDWSSISWQCYQKWSKLSEAVKQSWVEAGRTLQQFSAYLPKNAPQQQQLTPTKKSKPVLTAAERQEQQQTLLELQKELEDDESQVMNSLGLVRGKADKKPGLNQVWTKLKTADGEVGEFDLRTVEKIVAKRVNPKQKTPEYLIKWEGLPSDENTWEPVQNMTSCIKMVQEFERNLAKQKARKAAEANKQLLNKQQQFIVHDAGHSMSSSGTPGRPVRTSAKKALDQVKEWVKKRPLDSEDEDGDLDEYEPPAKKDPTADLSALLRRKIGGAVGGKSPLLLANSGGVVRVDPKSVPNLSSDSLEIEDGQVAEEVKENGKIEEDSENEAMDLDKFETDEANSKEKAEVDITTHCRAQGESIEDAKLAAADDRGAAWWLNWERKHEKSVEEIFGACAQFMLGVHQRIASIDFEKLLVNVPATEQFSMQLEEDKRQYITKLKALNVTILYVAGTFIMLSEKKIEKWLLVEEQIDLKAPDGDACKPCKSSTSSSGCPGEAVASVGQDVGGKCNMPLLGEGKECGESGKSDVDCGGSKHGNVHSCAVLQEENVFTTDSTEVGGGQVAEEPKETGRDGNEEMKFETMLDMNHKIAEEKDGARETCQHTAQSQEKNVLAAKIGAAVAAVRCAAFCLNGESKQVQLAEVVEFFSTCSKFVRRVYEGVEWIDLRESQANVLATEQLLTSLKKEGEEEAEKLDTLINGVGMFLLLLVSQRKKMERNPEEQAEVDETRQHRAQSEEGDVAENIASVRSVYDRGMAWFHNIREKIQNSAAVREFLRACSEFVHRPSYKRSDFAELLSNISATEQFLTQLEEEREKMLEQKAELNPLINAIIKFHALLLSERRQKFQAGAKLPNVKPVFWDSCRPGEACSSTMGLREESVANVRQDEEEICMKCDEQVSGKSEECDDDNCGGERGVCDHKDVKTSTSPDILLEGNAGKDVGENYEKSCEETRENEETDKCGKRGNGDSEGEIVIGAYKDVDDDGGTSEADIDVGVEEEENLAGDEDEEMDEDSYYEEEDVSESNGFEGENTYMDEQEGISEVSWASTEVDYIALYDFDYDAGDSKRHSPPPSYDEAMASDGIHGAATNLSLNLSVTPMTLTSTAISGPVTSYFDQLRSVLPSYEPTSSTAASYNQPAPEFGNLPYSDSPRSPDPDNNPPAAEQLPSPPGSPLPHELPHGSSMQSVEEELSVSSVNQDEASAHFGTSPTHTGLLPLSSVLRPSQPLVPTGTSSTAALWDTAPSIGVYILSSQQGLIKVDDPTAAKLTEAMKVDGRKVASEKTMMIHETEVRKIPASSATPKPAIYRKEVHFPRKNNILSSSGVKLIPKTVQRSTPNIVRINAPKAGGTTALSRQIILGNSKPRPLPGPVNSPLRPPIVRQKALGKPVMTPIRQKPQQLHQIQQLRMVKNEKEEDDFDAGIPDEFPKNEDPIAPPSPTRPMTLCPLTGEVLGRAEGERTPPPQDVEEPHPESDEDGMMRVEMSPGGTIRQVISRSPGQKGRSLLSQKRTIKVEEQVAEPPQEEEMISIESEDGVIYQITPEQQQILLQNGTLTMQEKSDDGTVVLPQESLSEEQAEILIENGQIVQRVVTGGDESEHAQEEDQEMLLAGQQLMEGEDGQMYNAAGNVLTLDSAVQEAVSQVPGELGETVKTEDSGQQMVAQIVQAEPPTPGGGPRKVVLLLPDGSLINTEMDEEQYQALDFEK